MKLSAAEAFWYFLGCISFGASYLAKVPVKKALSEYGVCAMTSGESFWYVLENIALGSGYFSKVIIKKALNETNLVGSLGTARHAAFSGVGND